MFERSESESKRVFSLVLCVAAICLSACSQSVAGPTSNAGQAAGSATPALTLTGTLWKLQSFQRSDSTSVPVSNPSPFTLELGADGRMSVRADCNRCSATYSQTGDTFAVDPRFACTRAACSSAPFDQEYLTALAGTTIARVSGETLECVSAQGVLRFAR